MYDDQEILEQIKRIECPTGNVMERVIGVLEDYRPSGGYQITSHEDDDYIDDDMKVYRAYSETPGAPSIVVTVREGSDHYVASVIDAFIEDDKDGYKSSDHYGSDGEGRYMEMDKTTGRSVVADRGMENDIGRTMEDVAQGDRGRNENEHGQKDKRTPPFNDDVVAEGYYLD